MYGEGSVVVVERVWEGEMTVVGRELRSSLASFSRRRSVWEAVVERERRVTFLSENGDGYDVSKNGLFLVFRKTSRTTRRTGRRRRPRLCDIYAVNTRRRLTMPQPSTL